MIRTSLIFIGILFSAMLLAQRNGTPRRTAEDIARKQTEMLVRELDITDSLLRDTLFRLHLKYAELQFVSNTRSEAIQRILLMQEELRGILSAEQYEAFMNRQLDTHSRLPHHPCNWIGPHHNGSHGSPAMPDTLTSPPEHLLTDHP